MRCKMNDELVSTRSNEEYREIRVAPAVYVQLIEYISS